MSSLLLKEKNPNISNVRKQEVTVQWLKLKEKEQNILLCIKDIKMDREKVNFNRVH